MEHNIAFYNLPNEALSLVLLNLSLKDLIGCSTINKLFNELVNQNFIWKNLFIKDHNGTIISHEGSWKELYKQDAPLLNLKNGRFFYRCLAKVVKMPNVNGDLERLYEFNSEIGGVVNKTVNYRGSYSPSTTLSSDFVDLNTLEHFPIKGPSGKHIMLVGRYWLVFDMETQTAPYQSGISFQNIHVYRVKPHPQLGTDRPDPKLPSKTVATLSMEWLPKTLVWGEFSGSLFVHIRRMRTPDYKSIESTLLRFYDFARNSKMRHEVTVPGDLLSFSATKLAYCTGKVGHSFQLYDWKEKGDLATTSITISIPNEQQLFGIALTSNQIVTYDAAGFLTLFDDTTGKVLKQYNIEEQTKTKGGTLNLVDNVCCLSQLVNKKRVGWAVIDLRTGQVVQTLNLGGRWNHLKPLGAAGGKFNGKFLALSEGDVGIMDLANPHIHEQCTVLSIPCADSVDTAQLGVKFHRISSAQLWRQLAGLCECPGFQLDSQVIKEVKLVDKKYRYVVVFNSMVNGGQPQSQVLTQLFATCPFQHDDSAPLQSISLDLNTPRIEKEDYGYGNRNGRFKQTSETWPASLLKGYGPAVLVLEIWSTKYGWIPSHVPNDFELETLLSGQKTDSETEPLGGIPLKK